MDISVAIRESGEKLAEIAECFGSCDAESADSTAIAFLDAAKVHVYDLIEGNLAQDALATGVMTLLTIFHKRVNPEAFAAKYLAFLEELFLLSSQCHRQAAGEESDHFAEISVRLGVLAVVSYRNFDHSSMSEGLVKRSELLTEMYRDAPQEAWYFQGKEIVPQTAMDILYDTASRLHSMGLVD